MTNDKKDENQIASSIIEQITQDSGVESEAIEAKKSENEQKPEKNPAAVALGRLGGLKGGKARAEKLSKKKRQEIAKKAAEARWSNKNK